MQHQGVEDVGRSEGEENGARTAIAAAREVARYHPSRSCFWPGGSCIANLPVLRRLSMLIDAAFGNFGQQFVGLLFLSKRGIK
jgi:hypothetical protein